MGQAAETHHRSSSTTGANATSDLSVSDRLRGALRAVSFWVAIVLPFLHLPLLAVGPQTRAELVAFFVLLGINILAVTLGHQHRPTGVTIHR